MTAPEAPGLVSLGRSLRWLVQRLIHPSGSLCQPFHSVYEAMPKKDLIQILIGVVAQNSTLWNINSSLSTKNEELQALFAQQPEEPEGLQQNENTNTANGAVLEWQVRATPDSYHLQRVAGEVLEDFARNGHPCVGTGPFSPDQNYVIHQCFIINAMAERLGIAERVKDDDTDAKCAKTCEFEHCIRRHPSVVSELILRQSRPLTSTPFGSPSRPASMVGGQEMGGAARLRGPNPYTSETL
jgi:hypothetical protein